MPPKRPKDLEEHAYGAEFRQAEAAHLASHQEMRSWVEVTRANARGNKVLDCRWVYTYKFDKHGRFLQAKARLVVRGD